jgi:cytochrome c peroxidase
MGRVLFYDNSLSSTNAVACASCHIQANAFGDVQLLVTELMAQQLGTL